MPNNNWESEYKSHSLSRIKFQRKCYKESIEQYICDKELSEISCFCSGKVISYVAGCKLPIDNLEHCNFKNLSLCQISRLLFHISQCLAKFSLFLSDVKISSDNMI